MRHDYQAHQVVHPQPPPSDGREPGGQLVSQAVRTIHAHDAPRRTVKDDESGCGRSTSRLTEVGEP
jgi:hypothetical protein